MTDREPVGEPVATGLTMPAIENGATTPATTAAVLPEQGLPADAAAAAPPPARPAGLRRWGVALAVLAVTVGVVSVALAMLAAGGGASSVQGWLPADTVAYLEVRADMPGDQRAKLGDILAKFPGFADQASTDAKIDEALDKLLEKSDVSWSRDLKPWVGGEVGVALTKPLLELVGRAQSGAMPSATPDDGLVVLAGVKDESAAKAWVTKAIKGTQTTESYAGGDLTRVESDGAVYAFAVRKGVLLLGPVKTVKASLDTAGASAFAKSAAFVDARKSAADAYLGFTYLDFKAFYDVMLASAQSQGSIPGACLPAGAAAAIPPWTSGFSRAEDAAIVFTSTTPMAGNAPTATGSPSEIATHLPGTTLAAVEARDFGPALVAGLDALKAGLSCDPATADAWKQIDQALGLLGGPSAIIGWAGDTAIALTASGTSFGGGLAAVTSDEAAASRTLSQLKTLVALGGSQAGIGTRDEAYGEATLVVLTLPSGAGEIPEFAATVHAGVFAMGTIDFVKAVLDSKAGSSLADAAVYKRAIQQAGGDGVADFFVDIAGVRGAAERLMPERERPSYETNTRPFVQPFEAFAAVIKAPSTTSISRAVITFAK